MKGPKKITRVHLDVNDQDEPSVFGIVTADPDYKFTLKLNRKLHILLKAFGPVKIRDNEGKELIFSKFSDKKGAPELVFDLFSNRSGKYFLVKKLENVDFLFMVHDHERNWQSEDLTTQLREIDNVTAVFNLDFKTLKDKNLKYLI
jgi:hypothetical protein